MATYFMDTVFDSSLALLAIIVPLGVAYFIIFLQGHNRRGENRNDCQPDRAKMQNNRIE